jgi:UDP-glucuronate 4-epimerase
MLEEKIGTAAIKKFLPLQSGDVLETFANIDDLIDDIHYKPRVSIAEGIAKFIDWYKEYYKI